MKDKVTAIILMAGVGKRMNSKVPKQYIHVDNKPIAYYTIKAFEESSVDDIVLVTGKDEIEYCTKNIVQYFNFKKVTGVVCGGKERYNSVLNGLEYIKESDYVLIHDGARPCILSSTINMTIEFVKEYKACIVGVPSKDTVKIVDKDNNIIGSPNRDNIWQAQTPQCFLFENIKEAYRKLVKENNIIATDDAAVWSKYEELPVKMLEGSYDNIKVTTPSDLQIIANELKNI